MTLPSEIIHVLVTMSLLCNLSLAPIQPPWDPDPAEVTALAQTLYGECRGCSELQQKAVCWCVFNRVDDSRFPDSVIEVITQPSQFFGYSESFPVTEELKSLARDCLTDWHYERERVLEPDFVFFWGDSKRNHFTTEWRGGQEWCEG